MFRRKEEGLFDNTTDPNQLQEDVAESASMASQSAAAPAAPAYHPAASSYNAPAASAAPAAPSARPAAPAPTANAFRPGAPASAPLSADITRRPLPETKSAAAQASTAPASAAKTTRVLTVGNDILLKGEIATCDRLVIEGKVDATLNDVHTVEIAEGGSFKGSAQIEDAEISGLFEGDLTVRGRLVIYATGKVRGKISYGEIEIQRGGELTGEIKIAGAAAAGARPARAKEDNKAAA